MALFNFRLWHDSEQPTAAKVAKDLADAEHDLGHQVERLEALAAEMSDPAIFGESEWEHLNAERVKILNEQVRLRAVIEGNKADLETAKQRDANAARDARLAEAPAIAKRAKKPLTEIDKAARALSALLAEQAVDEGAYSERERDAKDAKRGLPRLYADRDVSAEIVPETTVYEEKWMVKKLVNNGTAKEPVFAEYWTGCGMVHQNKSGKMVPDDASAVLREVPRVIPEQIVRRAQYFQSPTATTVIAGHWPRA